MRNGTVAVFRKRKKAVTPALSARTSARRGGGEGAEGVGGEGEGDGKRSHARRNLYDLDTVIDAAVDV